MYIQTYITALSSRKKSGSSDNARVTTLILCVDKLPCLKCASSAYCYLPTERKHCMCLCEYLNRSYAYCMHQDYEIL